CETKPTTRRSRPVSPLLSAVPRQPTFPSGLRRSQTARLLKRRGHACGARLAVSNSGFPS
ncbi:hypothetical protein C8T65DRAFT_675982, partial [Cerioporus squamosus]